MVRLMEVGEGERRDKLFLQSLLSHDSLPEEKMLELYKTSARLCGGKLKTVLLLFFGCFYASS